MAPAHAALTATQICDQFGVTTVHDSYVVQNNRYGTTDTQCVETVDDGVRVGFTVTQADGSVPTDGPAKSYPSIYNGCYHGTCSPGTTLPMQISQLNSAPSLVRFFRDYSGAVYDSSYKVMLDPTPRTDGDNRTEVDAWFNHAGDVHPIGTKVGTSTAASLTWDVWLGNNGTSDVLTLVSSREIHDWTFNTRTFLDEAVTFGVAQKDWYLTSVQAGFEPWQGGSNLEVGCFYSQALDLHATGGGTSGSIDWWDMGNTDGSTTYGMVGGSTSGGSTSGGTTSGGTTSGGTTGGTSGDGSCPVPTSSPTPTATATETPTGSSTCGLGTSGGTTTGGSSTCGATQGTIGGDCSWDSGGTTTDGGTQTGCTIGGTTTIGGSTGGTTSGNGAPTCKVTYSPQVWPGGFTANVTVTNTGSSAVSGWKLGFTLPSGQTVTNAWNATVSPSSGAVSATNMAYNGSIPAGGSQSFGFQGTSTGSTAVPTSFTLNGAACA
ncbi:cellulose binding domain-containing protein [Streptomyces sp. NPDC020983]|uniref:GH12 family glycosyl hydrolase domain-containing protein n=1 Tax=Streptomyces sp. NPDC020983 TaxID=3365106 RepID=UPI003791067E